MKYVYMFSWNIPKDNQLAGKTDRYLNIISEWDGKGYYDNGNPIVYIDLVNPSLYTCMQVKNWIEAENQIKEVAKEHFKDIARQERINRARAELIAQGELLNNPVLERYENLYS